MGGIASMAGGKGGGGGGGGSGLSGEDIALLEQAVGQNMQMIHNRYAQLGLGIPSGDPAQAAAHGQNLQYAGAGTAENMDIQGQQNILQAALGQLQNANQGNPAIPGSFANQAQNLQQLAGQQYGQGYNNPPTGGSTTGTPV
jgi:hypothetical protein